MATLAEQWEVEAPRKVSPATQAERDVTRRQLVEEELDGAKKRLAAGDTSVQGKIDWLNKELSNIKPAATQVPSQPAAANESAFKSSFADLWEAKEQPKPAQKVIDRSIPTEEALARPDLEVKPVEQKGGTVYNILKGILEPRRITQEAIKGLGEAGEQEHIARRIVGRQFRALFDAAKNGLRTQVAQRFSHGPIPHNHQFRCGQCTLDSGKRGQDRPHALFPGKAAHVEHGEPVVVHAPGRSKFARACARRKLRRIHASRQHAGMAEAAIRE